MTHLTQIQLTNFRSYERAFLDDLREGVIVLTGTNGAGKTNLLEALSLLVPGKGLRRAKSEELQNITHASSAPWAVSCQLMTSYGSVRIGTGCHTDSRKRIVRINGETAKSQSALSEYLASVWLTPQMDRLFLDSSAQRRRFFDRLVFAFDPGHAGRLTRYDHALSERSKLLKNGVRDESWLSGIETQMAETGGAIAAVRLDFIERLQTACDAADDRESAYFPKVRLSMAGLFEERLKEMPALEVEALFKKGLRAGREQDAITGGASVGPHRSDLLVQYARKNIPAEQCSTGEQKALLIGIMLAHARLVQAERGSPPLLLLDEVAAHLDESRRNALYERLSGLGGQVWLTGTDQSWFNYLHDTGQFFEIRENQILSG